MRTHAVRKTIAKHGYFAGVKLNCSDSGSGSRPPMASRLSGSAGPTSADRTYVTVRPMGYTTKQRFHNKRS
jgi:hypothetical protein